MSEERDGKPVLDEDGDDTDSVVREKMFDQESTGPKDDYQHVPGTRKSIGPDGRVMTEQPSQSSRPPFFPPGDGGLSVNFPDINIDVGDIHAPDLNISEPLFNIDIPQPLANVVISEPLLNIDIPQPLVDIDIPQPLVDVDLSEPIVNISIPQPLVDIDITSPLIDAPVDIDIPDIIMPDKIIEIIGPLMPDWPDIPDFPSIPENLINIVGPMVEIPEIPENLVNIVGPMVEIPEWPEEGLINVGDITMPEVVGIDIPLDEIPPVVQYGIAGGLILLGIGALLLGIGKTAGAITGIVK